MADGFLPLSKDKLNTPDGVSEINRMFQVLFENVAGDTDTVRVFRGQGSPEGVVSAGIGSLYQRLDGSSGTAIYIKETGTGNTGWNTVGTGSALSFIEGDNIVIAEAPGTVTIGVDLIVGASRGDIYYVDQDIFGTLFIKKLPIGLNTQVLTTDGIVPFWDYVTATPGAEGSDRFTQVIRIFSGHEEALIIMDKLAEGSASLASMNNDDAENKDADDGNMSATSEEDITAMDKTQDTTVTLTLEIGSSVA